MIHNLCAQKCEVHDKPTIGFGVVKSHFFLCEGFIWNHVGDLRHFCFALIIRLFSCFFRKKKKKTKTKNVTIPYDKTKDGGKTWGNGNCVGPCKFVAANHEKLKQN